MSTTDKARRQWRDWIRKVGPSYFYRAFVEIAQGAEGRCTQCKERIYLDVVEGGGVPDWHTANGDYGCPASPDTSADGTGSHQVHKHAGS